MPCTPLMPCRSVASSRTHGTSTNSVSYSPSIRKCREYPHFPSFSLPSPLPFTRFGSCCIMRFEARGCPPRSAVVVRQESSHVALARRSTSLDEVSPPAASPAAIQTVERTTQRRNRPMLRMPNYVQAAGEVSSSSPTHGMRLLFPAECLPFSTPAVVNSYGYERNCDGTRLRMASEGIRLA